MVVSQSFHQPPQQYLQAQCCAVGLRPAPEMASDLHDDSAVGWAGCLRPSRWISPFQAVEVSWNAEGGPCCMQVTEAAVMMEGLVWGPAQTCLGLTSCLGLGAYS